MNGFLHFKDCWVYISIVWSLTYKYLYIQHRMYNTECVAFKAQIYSFFLKNRTNLQIISLNNEF